MDKLDIKKNIHDLEYQHILNLQNLVLGIIGALMIGIILLDPLPSGWLLKENIIFMLVIFAFIFFLYFRKRLRLKIDAIKRMKLDV